MATDEIDYYSDYDVMYYDDDVDNISAFTNATHPSGDEFYYEGETQAGVDTDWAFTVFDVLLGIAVVVNLCVVLVVMSGRQLRRSASAILIVSVVISDLLHLVLIRVSHAVVWRFEMDPLGDLFCKLGVFMDSLFGGLTAYLLVILATEHYMAVVQPLSLQKRRCGPRSWSVIGVLLALTVAFLVALPDFFLHAMEDITRDDDYYYYYYDDDVNDYVNHYYYGDGGLQESVNSTEAASTDANSTTSVVIGRHCELVGVWYPLIRPAMGVVVHYILPMSLIAAMYGRVACTLVGTSPEYGQCGRDVDERRRRRRQTARSLVMFVIVVVVFLLPLNIVTLLNDYELVDHHHIVGLAIFSLWTFALTSLSYAGVIAALSHQFRRRVLHLLGIDRCLRRCRPSAHPITTSTTGLPGSRRHGDGLTKSTSTTSSSATRMTTRL